MRLRSLPFALAAIIAPAVANAQGGGRLLDEGTFELRRGGARVGTEAFQIRAIGENLTWYCSTPLGYDPKLHLGCDLAPLDLYVKHRRGLANFVMKRILPYLGPTRGDKTLPAFANYREMWGDDAGG